MKKIEVGKSYKTRDGREVRIYTLDGIGLQAIHGAILNEGEGEWSCQTWDVQGQFLEGETSIFDIVIPPLKYEGVDKVQSFGGHSILFVPDEFAGLEVKFTLEVLDEIREAIKWI